jgi:glycosyltransferase involved in cell wall biosynthesis
MSSSDPTPSLSVVVPTYNRADFIPDLVASLTSARIAGLEIVIVDDGSTDHTEAVVRAMGPLVRYVRQENAGPAAARNLGRSISQGGLITFLDSDDCWRPAAFRSFFDAVHARADFPCAFGDAAMGSRAAGFASFVQTYGQALPAVPSVEVGDRLRQFEQWPFFKALARRNVVFLGSLIVRREVFDSVGGFNPQLRGAADWEFFMRLASRYPMTLWGGDPVCEYLKHTGGMSVDRDHMEEEFALALTSVLERCDLPENERQFVRQRLREQRFGIAYRAYDRGDLRVARTRLWQMRDRGFVQWRESSYLLLSYLPSGVVNTMRRVKHALQRSAP